MLMLDHNCNSHNVVDPVTTLNPPPDPSVKRLKSKRDTYSINGEILGLLNGEIP